MLTLSTTCVFLIQMTTRSDIWTYNPSQMSREELLETLVGRDELLANLTQHCRDSLEQGASGGHVLLWGPRGIGKTTLLRALRLGLDSELSRRLIPIVFSEEEHSVTGVHSLLARVVELSGEAAAWPPPNYRKLPSPDLVGALEEHAGASRAYLLLPENFSDLLDRVVNHEKPELCELFARLFCNPKFLFVATSITVLRPPKGRKGQTLRDIASCFTPQRVEGLPELAREVIRKRAAWDGRKDLLDQPDVAGKVRAVAKLSGGNPRYLVELYGMLGGQGVLDIEEEFMRFLNRCTAAQQGLLKDLSGSASAALEAVARRRGIAAVSDIVEDLITPDDTEADAAKRVRNAVGELVAAGFLTERPRRGREKVYAVHPPAFQLWYEMRYLDAEHQRLWLLKFFETGVLPEDAARDYLQQLQGSFEQAAERANPSVVQDSLRDLFFFSHLVPADSVADDLAEDCRKLLEQGKWREAANECRLARDRAAAVPDSSRVIGFAVHEAACLSWGGNAGEARDLLAQVGSLVEQSDVSPEIAARYHLGMASVLDDLSQIPAARQELEAAQAAIDRCDTSVTAQRLAAQHARLSAFCDMATGDARAAVPQLETALSIWRKISTEPGARRGEGADLGNLGNAYSDLGEVRRAIEFYELGLQIAREIGDRSGEGRHVGNLGNAYGNLGEVRKAIEFYEQALRISREIGNRRGEGCHVGNLGTAYGDLGEVRKAIEFFEQGLRIAREIGDRSGEGNHLGNLGYAYGDLGEVRKAIDFYDQALQISREIGDRNGEGSHLGNLGNAYSDLGEVRKAIDFHEQALQISREIGDRSGEGNHLGNLGSAYSDLGEMAKACRHLEEAAMIAEEVENRSALLIIRQNLARTLAAELRFADAAAHARGGLDLAIQLDMPKQIEEAAKLSLQIALIHAVHEVGEDDTDAAARLLDETQQVCGSLSDAAVASELYARFIAPVLLDQGEQAREFIRSCLELVDGWGRPAVSEQLSPVRHAVVCANEEEWNETRSQLPPGESEAAEAVWDTIHSGHELRKSQKLLEQDNPAAALAAADEFLERHPDDVRGLQLAIRAGGAAKDREAVEARIERATQWAPENVEIRKLATQTLMQFGRSDEALIHAERAAVLTPDDADVQVSHGRALVACKQFPEAYDAMARAVELDPQQKKPQWRLELAETGLLTDRLAEARRALLAFSAEAAEPKYRAVHHWLRVCHALFRGDRSAARREVTELIAFWGTVEPGFSVGWSFGDLLGASAEKLAETDVALLREMTGVIQGEKPVAPFALAHADQESAQRLLEHLAATGKASLQSLENGLVSSLSDIQLHAERATAIEAFFDAMEREYAHLTDTAKSAADRILAEAIAQGGQREKLSAIRAAGAHMAEFSAATQWTIVDAMLDAAENADESSDVRDLAVRVLTIAYYDLPQDARDKIGARLRALSASYRPPALADFLAHL